MSRAPCTFRESDVKRAVRAARAAGIEVVRVEVDREGRITIISARDEASCAETVNEWDTVS